MVNFIPSSWLGSRFLVYYYFSFSYFSIQDPPPTKTVISSIYPQNLTVEALTMVNNTPSTWRDSCFRVYYYLALVVVKQPPSSWPDSLSAQRHSLLCPVLPFSCTHAIVTEPDVYYCDSC